VSPPQMKNLKRTGEKNSKNRENKANVALPLLGEADGKPWVIGQRGTVLMIRAKSKDEVDDKGLLP